MEQTEAATNAESFTLVELVADLLPDAEFEAQQRSCSISVVGGCDCQVQGSPELIYRAIENIVRNAVRYTKEHSAVEINIRCEGEAGARMVMSAVADCGPGLPENRVAEHLSSFLSRGRCPRPGYRRLRCGPGDRRSRHTSPPR